MKTLLSLVLSLGFASILSAQVINFTVVGKTHEFDQTDISTVAEAQPGSGPWSFGAYVIGDGSMTASTPISTASFTGSGATASGPLTYDPTRGEWQAEYFYDTQSTLQGNFFDGASSNPYTMTLGSYTTPALNMDSTLYPNMPIMSVTSGSAMWSGNMLMVDPTQTLVLTSSTFSTNFLTGSTRIGWGISGPSYTDEVAGGGDLVGTTATITIAAGSLISGSTYDLYVEFNRFSGQTMLTGTGITGLEGATYVTMLSSATNLRLFAVPEPSTYALLAGLTVLMGAAWTRRRLS